MVGPIGAVYNGAMSTPKRSPNILLFTTDQHRGDCIGLADGSAVETPNLDGIADAYFPNAYTEIPSTTGARRVLLSGRASHACGVIGYSSTEWDESTSIATVLAHHGYHCINVGWRNLHPRRKLYGFHEVVPHDLREGADEYWEWLKAELGPYAHERAGGVDSNGWLAKPWELEERYHATNWTVAETIRQLKRRDPTKPFFLWCSHLRPHSPYDPPQFFWDMYIDRKLPTIPVGDWARKYEEPSERVERTAWHGRLSDEVNQRQRAGYYGSITHIDYQLGHLIEMLRSMQLWNDTLVIFVSDHGDMMSDHHLHRKCYAYEGSARIPFVLRYPQGTDLPCGTFGQVVGLQDVMPTVLDLLGIETPEWVTGRSVLPAIRGESIREFFHGEHSPCYDLTLGMHYLTDGRQKYVWYPVTNTEQLFDLESDRQELRDLAPNSEYAGELATWRNRLVEILAKRNDPLTDGEYLVPTDSWYGPEV